MSSYTKLNATDDLKIGDLFVNSWGYDQTNIDYYQVVKKTKKTISVLPINSKIIEDGFMQGKSIPLKNNFVKDAKETKKVPYKYVGDSCLSDTVWINFEFGSGKLFTGDSARCSWYA